MEYNTKKYKTFKNATRIYKKVQETLDTLQLCCMSYLALEGIHLGNVQLLHNAKVDISFFILVIYFILHLKLTIKTNTIMSTIKNSYAAKDMLIYVNCQAINFVNTKKTN